MCGIVGMIGFDGVAADRALVERMSASIVHRGPDEDGIYVSGSVGLAMRRLSILDLSPTGHQPMFSPDGQVVMVYNGEIYNYVELREELKALGHEFRSTGDTEVLLHAYLEWGHDCLPKLNGMWGFLIYDMRNRTIFGSRDRFGKKPLFWHRRKDCILFASEIKAIYASGRYEGGANMTKVATLLLSTSLDTMDEDTDTFHAGIQQIAPGYGFELDLDGKYREWCYWTLEDYQVGGSADIDIENPGPAFFETFENACRIRMRSDVPVGVFLSGGIDSTSIACSMARAVGANRTKPVLALSYQTEEFDETRYINDTLKQTGVELVSCNPEPARVWDMIEGMLRAQDEPVHSLTAVITYQLYRMAKERGVKVILNGSGPDEYLAGYPSLFVGYWCSLLQEGRIAETWREIKDFCAEQGGRPRERFRRAVRHLFQGWLGRFGAYRRFSVWNRRRRYRRRPWFRPELVDHVSVVRQDIDPGLPRTLRRCMEDAPLPVYVRIDDRNAMAHSVEARIPFLDYRLVAYAFQLPARAHMKGPYNKYLLRQAMKGKIPESVRTRVHKFGFPVPMKDWIGGELYEPIRDLLASQEARERGYYNVDAVQRGLERHRKGEVDFSSQLFNVAQIEIWSRSLKATVPA